MEGSEKLFQEISDACGRVKETIGDNCAIVFHDDADGVTAAAIMLSCLQSIGISPQRVVCLEKLFPEVVRKLQSEMKGGVIFYLDIGAPHAKLISETNAGKNLIIILDHHDAVRADDPLVLNLDPELFGISGEHYVSGATITYLFSKELASGISKNAHLAVVGSAEIPGNMRGLNRIPLDDAISAGRVSVKKKDGEEQYLIKVRERYYSHRELSKILTILASVGYYENGPMLAIKACVEDFPPEILRTARSLEERRKSANSSLIRRLRREGLRVLGRVQYFDSHDAFEGMGVKVIGTFCSYLSYQRWISKDRYIIGFMKLRPELPGIGKLEGDLIKVSARVPPELKSKIERGEMPPLSFVLAEACRRVGGFGDGHAVAASGVIPSNKKDEFLREFNKIVREWISKRG